MATLTDNDIKGIMLDFGGTIDSSGDHWSEVIYDAYGLNNLNVDKKMYRECYVEAEKALAARRLIYPCHTFLDLMRIKIALQFDAFKARGLFLPSELIDRVAQKCYDFAKASVESCRPTLQLLNENYPVALISNFYGNIESVLLDYGIRHYFKAIIESSVVGVRKPDPRIFRLGAVALDLPPENLLVVGDSYKKDILPALSIGCSAVWIKGRQWKEEKENDEAPVPCADALSAIPVILGIA